MRKPDFFFVGHPRCGTSLLYSFLRAHPDIYMARKELHYFGADIGYQEPNRRLSNYLGHFAGASTETRVGDASTWYLASRTAAEEIARFNPHARILIALREPTSWLYSLYQHLYYNGDEDEPSFAAALDAEAGRAGGLRRPANSIPRIALAYRAHVDLCAQISRYFDQFPADQIHILLADDLRADPMAAYQSVLRFLTVAPTFEGIEDVVSGDTRVRNSFRVVRSPALRHLYNAPPLRRVFNGVDLASSRLPARVVGALKRFNTKFSAPPRIDPTVRARLQAEFRPEVERLASLIDRDLSAWLPST